MASKKSQTVKYIKNNIVYYLADDEIQSKHTVESKRKLSEARRNRKVQPNAGTSKKSSNFYTQLLKDYTLKGKHEDQNLDPYIKEQLRNGTLNKRVETEFKEWLVKNKSKFSLTKESCKEEGIITDYSAQYDNFAEIQIDEVLYDSTDKSRDSQFESNSDTLIEWQIFYQRLVKQINFLSKMGLDADFLKDYKELEEFKFDVYNQSDLDWSEIDDKLEEIFANRKMFKDDKEIYTELGIKERLYRCVNKTLEEFGETDE